MMNDDPPTTLLVLMVIISLTIFFIFGRLSVDTKVTSTEIKAAEELCREHDGLFSIDHFIITCRDAHEAPRHD